MSIILYKTLKVKGTAKGLKMAKYGGFRLRARLRFGRQKTSVFRHFTIGVANLCG